MAHIAAQVIIPYDSGLPEDVAVNTFHFSGIDEPLDMAVAVRGRLSAFYNSVYAPLTSPLLSYYSKVVNVVGARCKVYDMSDPEPRVPILNESMGWSTQPTGTGLPEEVALCLSYRGRLESGTNPARRRGRIYLGPWNVSAITETTVTGNYSRPLGNLINGIANAGKALANENTLGAQWSVYSKRNEDLVEIEAGWVDNSWDTQRRRGARSTDRYNWAVEVP